MSKYDEQGDVDYVDMILNRRTDTKTHFDDELPITKDPAVRTALVISLILAVVIGIVITFAMRALVGQESTFEYTERHIDSDSELMTALGSNTIYTYRLSNISYQADQVYDSADIISNNRDYSRIDYICKVYLIENVKRHGQGMHSTYKKSVPTFLPCQNRIAVPDSTITIAGHVLKITPHNYETPGSGYEFPLNTYNGLQEDLFDHNYFEDNHPRHQYNPRREVYKIKVIPKNSKVSFWANVGQGKLTPINPEIRNEATFVFGKKKISQNFYEPLVTRNKVLLFAEITLLIFTILWIYHIRSQEYY